MHALVSTPDQVHALFQAVQTVKANAAQVPGGTGPVPVSQPAQPAGPVQGPAWAPPSGNLQALLAARLGANQTPMAPPVVNSAADVNAGSGSLATTGSTPPVTADAAMRAAAAKALVDRIRQNSGGQGLPGAPITTVSDNGGGFLNSLVGGVIGAAGSLGGQLVQAAKPPPSITALPGEVMSGLGDVANVTSNVATDPIGTAKAINATADKYGSGQAILQDIKNTPGAVVDAYGHLPGFVKDYEKTIADISPIGPATNGLFTNPVQYIKDMTYGKTAGQDIAATDTAMAKAFVEGTPSTVINAMTTANGLPIIGRLMNTFTVPFKENTAGLGNVMYLQSQGKPIDGFWNNVWLQNENWKADIEPWATDPKNAQAISDAYTKGIDTNGDKKPDLFGGAAVFALFFAQAHPADGNLWDFVNTVVDSMGYDPLTTMPALAGVTKALETGAEGIDATNAAKDAAVAQGAEGAAAPVTDVGATAPANAASAPLITTPPTKPTPGYFTVVDGKAVPTLRDFPPFPKDMNPTEALAANGEQVREVIRTNAQARAAADAYNAAHATPEAAATAARANTQNIVSSPLNVAPAPGEINVTDFAPSVPMKIASTINDALNSPAMADAMMVAARVTGTPEAINNAVLGALPAAARSLWNQLPEDTRTAIINSKLLYPFKLTKNAQGELAVEQVHTGMQGYSQAAEDAAARQTGPAQLEAGSLGSTQLSNEDVGMPPPPAEPAPPPGSSVPPDAAATKANPLADAVLSPETSASAATGGTAASTFDVVDPRDGQTYTFTTARDAQEMADSLSRDTGQSVTVETAQTKATAAQTAADAAAAKAKVDAVPVSRTLEKGKPVTVVGNEPDALVKVRVSSDGVYSLEDKKANQRYGPVVNAPAFDPKNQVEAETAAKQVYLDKLSGTAPTNTLDIAKPQPAQAPLDLNAEAAVGGAAAPAAPEAVPTETASGNKVTPVKSAPGTYTVDTPAGQYGITKTPTGVDVITPDGKTDPALSAPTVDAALTKIDQAAKPAPSAPAVPVAAAPTAPAGEAPASTKINWSGKEIAPTAPAYTPPTHEPRTYSIDQPNPLKAPERIAGLQAGTVNPFDPVAGGPRVIDRAAELLNSKNPEDVVRAKAFESANQPARAQAYAVDRQLQTQIDAARAARSDAMTMKSGTPEREAAYQAAHAQVQAKIIDQQINGVTHAVQTAEDYATHIGGPPPEPFVDEANRAQTFKGTGELHSSDPNAGPEANRTQAGNLIKASRDETNGGTKYTIVGGSKESAVITKGADGFTVTVKGKTVGVVKDEIAATKLADASIKPQKAGFQAESPAYLIDRGVLQGDNRALEALKPTITPDQYGKVVAAKERMDNVRAGIVGPDTAQPGGVLGVIDPASARLINEGVLKPGSNLERMYQRFTSTKRRTSIDPFNAEGVNADGMPKSVAGSGYEKDFWKLEDGPRALVTAGKLSMPDAQAVSRVMTTADGEATTVAAMYDNLRLSGMSPEDANAKVVETYADNIRAGLVNKDFAGMSEAEKGKILKKMADGKGLTADEMGKFKKRVATVLRKWDSGQGAIRENIQYNWVTGMRGAAQDTIFDTFTSILSGHGGAYAFSPSDLAMFKRAITDTDPTLLNDLKMANILKEADLQVPIEYIAQNRVGRYDEFANRDPLEGASGRTQTDILAPKMKMEQGLTNLGVNDTVAKVVTAPFASKLIKTTRNTLDAGKKIALYIDSYKQLLPEARDSFFRLIDDRAATLGKDGEAMKQAILDSAKSKAEANGQMWTGNFAPSDVSTATGDTSLTRAWQHEQTNLVKGAKAEADRILFTYRKTNIDQLLSHNVFFHYWATRSMVLHADIALHNPFLMSTYLRTWDRIKYDAKQAGMPASLSGYLHFMGNTAAGMYGVFDPVAYLVPTQMFQNAGNANDPWWKRAGLFVTPWTEGALAVFGLTSNVPNMTGTLSVENMVRHVADYMNANGIPIIDPHGITMPWTSGEQVTPDFVQELEGQLLKGANGVMKKVTGGMTPTYGPYNPVSNSTVQIRSLIHKYAEDAYGPEFNQDGSIRWTDQQVQHVSDADARAGFGDTNHMEANDLSDRAYKTWAKGEAVGALENLAIPVSVRSGPLDTMNKLKKTQVPAGTAPPTGQENAKDTLALIQTGSKPAYDLNVAGNYLANTGTPDTQMYYTMYNDIVYGANPAAELAPSDQRIGPAATAFNAKITAMSTDERKALATQWLESLYGPKALTDLQAQYTARDQVKAANPILQDYSAWASGIGGMDDNQFNQYVRGNPNYARYINGLKDSVKTDPVKFDAAKTDHVAYDNAMGNQANAYDQPPISTKAANKVPLQPGDITGATAGAGSTPKLSTQAQLSKDIAKYQTDSASYNAAAGVYAGAGRPIDVANMNPMARSALEAKLSQLGISPPSMSTLLRNYIAWANLQTQVGKSSTPVDYANWLASMQSSLGITDPNALATGVLSGSASSVPTQTTTGP